MYDKLNDMIKSGLECTRHHELASGVVVTVMYDSRRDVYYVMVDHITIYPHLNKKQSDAGFESYVNNHLTALDTMKVICQHQQ